MQSPPDSWINRGPAEEPQFDEDAYYDYWAELSHDMAMEERG